MLVDSDDEDYRDGCHTKLPAYGPVRALFESFFGRLSLGEVTFNGRACYTKGTGSSLVAGGKLLYAITLCVAMFLVELLL